MNAVGLARRCGAAAAMTLTLAVGGNLPSTPATASSSDGTEHLVNTTLDARDAVPGDGRCESTTGSNVCTLRAAVEEAQVAEAGLQEHVLLPAGTFTLTIGDLRISSGLGIRGAGRGRTVVSAADRFALLVVTSPTAGGVELDVSNLTLTRGFSSSGGGAIYNAGGNVRLSNVRIAANRAFSAGGGIYNGPGGRVELTDSIVNGNSGGPRGGGLANAAGGLLLVDHSTIVGNTATSGGGMLNNGEVGVAHSTISGNRALRGGGGILSTTNVELYRSTVTGNTANDRRGFEPDAVGGGIKMVPPARVNIRQSIVAANTDNRLGSDAAPDCQGPAKSWGGNVVGNSNSCALEPWPFPEDVVGSKSSRVSALLGPLRNNGGPTPTHALSAGSPAIDLYGHDRWHTCGFGDVDQRYRLRPADGNGDGQARCDAGAFEYRAVPTTANRTGLASHRTHVAEQVSLLTRDIADSPPDPRPREGRSPMTVVGPRAGPELLDAELAEAPCRRGQDRGQAETAALGIHQPAAHRAGTGGPTLSRPRAASAPEDSRVGSRCRQRTAARATKAAMRASTPAV